MSAAAETHFSQAEVATLHEHFKAISSAAPGDADGAGSIDRDEFLRAVGFSDRRSLFMEQMFAIFDVAPLGPDYLPGHGHADTLSFELSLFGHRFITNSGTSC